MRVLDKKLQKVLSLRTDSAEMLGALESLASFYSEENTLDARRNLRSEIEQRGLALSESFLGEMETIDENLSTLSLDVDKIVSKCDQLLGEMRAADDATSKFLGEIKMLSAERLQAEERVKAIEAFSGSFQLSEEQLRCLQTASIAIATPLYRGDSADYERPDQGDDREVDVSAPDFFSSLKQVEKIQSECMSLLNTDSEKAAIGISELMTGYKEAAHERLYRWLQDRCEKGFDFSRSETTLIRKAFMTLKAAPAYYDHCRERLVENRRAALVQEFSTALVEGTVGAQPIELHAHDSVRYVGDMLAWVHQAVANEKDMYVSILDGDAALLDKTIPALSPILMLRVRQVAASSSSMVTTYRVGDIVGFYVGTVRSCLRENARNQIVEDLVLLQQEITAQFFHLVKARTEKIVMNPPAYPSDLSVSHTVADMIHQMGDILVVYKGSMVLEEDQTMEVEDLLGCFLEPLLRIYETTAGLDRSDMAIYMANNIFAAQTCLARYDFAAPWVQKLMSNVSDWMDTLVSERATVILKSCGMERKLANASQYSGEAPLCGVSGMSAQEVGSAFNAFVNRLGSMSFTEFDRLTNPRLRVQARHGASLLLHEAYSKLFDIVQDGNNGYTFDGPLRGIHSPDQVKTLLSL